jgi:hypothetical protein
MKMSDAVHPAVLVDAGPQCLHVEGARGEKETYGPFVPAMYRHLIRDVMTPPPLLLVSS